MLFLSINLFTFLVVFAQMKTDTVYPAEYLVKNILLGEGATIANVKYTGNKASIGSFENNYPAFPLSNGIILSTGNVIEIQGPNDAPNRSGVMKTAGNKKLSKLINQRTYDAATLEFDFIPQADSLSFTFIFASEEYPEYVGSAFNDVFAFFIYENGDEQKEKNLAQLPESKETISINSINDKKNKHYYISNTLIIDRNKRAEAIYRYSDLALYEIIQLDGLTKPITISTKVDAGRTYHFTIAIADVSDENFDSAVLLKAGSFSSKSSMLADIKPVPPKKANSEPKLNDVQSLSEGQSLKFIYPVQFAFNSSEIPDEFKDVLNIIASLLNDNTVLRLEITGHTDNIGKEDYNLSLSAKRAESVMKYLCNKGVASERLNAQGKGQSQPIADNASEEGRYRNRRVEFSFYIPAK